MAGAAGWGAEGVSARESPLEIIPPYSVEAEREVIACVLANNEALDRLAGVIEPADCYVVFHRDALLAAFALVADGKLADAVTVASWLKDHGLLPDGGVDDLIDMAASSMSAVNVVQYAEIVRERAIRRAIIAAAHDMVATAQDARGLDSRAMLDKAQALINGVDERSARGRGTFRLLGDVVTELVAQVDDAARANSAIGFNTGWHGLDRLMNPMMPGQLVVVGARPGVGKTSLAVNVGLHVATTFRAGVGMFSMEMTDIEVALRVVSGESGVPAGRFREHRMGEREWSAVNGVIKAVHDAPFHIDHAGGLSVQELIARARVAAKQVGGFGLLIIDYLQLMRSEGRHDNRAVEIGEITRLLKRLAKELGCTVMALSQLNREAAKENKRPSIAELRDSGAIEADADTVLLLHRPFVVSQKPECEFDAEIIIGKQRNGQIGTAHLDYDARFTKFYDQGTAPGRK